MDKLGSSIYSWNFPVSLIWNCLRTVHAERFSFELCFGFFNVYKFASVDFFLPELSRIVLPISRQAKEHLATVSDFT